MPNDDNATQWCPECETWNVHEQQQEACSLCGAKLNPPEKTWRDFVAEWQSA